jgi:hypothetical protein
MEAPGSFCGPLRRLSCQASRILPDAATSSAVFAEAQFVQHRNVRKALCRSNLSMQIASLICLGQPS